MLGLAQAIYGPKDEELVVIVEGAGEPEEDEPFRVRLDFEHPSSLRSSFARLATLQRSSAGPYSLKSMLGLARTLRRSNHHPARLSTMASPVRVGRRVLDIASGRRLRGRPVGCFKHLIRDNGTGAVRGVIGEETADHRGSR